MNKLIFCSIFLFFSSISYGEVYHVAEPYELHQIDPCSKQGSVYINNNPRFIEECLSCGKEVIDGYCCPKCPENSFYALPFGSESIDEYECYACDTEKYTTAEEYECAKCANRAFLALKEEFTSHDGPVKRKSRTGFCITNEALLKTETELGVTIDKVYR